MIKMGIVLRDISEVADAMEGELVTDSSDNLYKVKNISGINTAVGINKLYSEYSLRQGTVHYSDSEFDTKVANINFKQLLEFRADELDDDKDYTLSFMLHVTVDGEYRRYSIRAVYHLSSHIASFVSIKISSFDSITDKVVFSRDDDSLNVSLDGVDIEYVLCRDTPNTFRIPTMIEQNFCQMKVLGTATVVEPSYYTNMVEYRSVSGVFNGDLSSSDLYTIFSGLNIGERASITVPNEDMLFKIKLPDYSNGNILMLERFSTTTISGIYTTKDTVYSVTLTTGTTLITKGKGVYKPTDLGSNVVALMDNLYQKNVSGVITGNFSELPAFIKTAIETSLGFSVSTEANFIAYTIPGNVDDNVTQYLSFNIRENKLKDGETTLYYGRNINFKFRIRISTTDYFDSVEKLVEGNYTMDFMTNVFSITADDGYYTSQLTKYTVYDRTYSDEYFMPTIDATKFKTYEQTYAGFNYLKNNVGAIFTVGAVNKLPDYISMQLPDFNTSPTSPTYAMITIQIINYSTDVDEETVVMRMVIIDNDPTTSSYAIGPQMKSYLITLSFTEGANPVTFFDEDIALKTEEDNFIKPVSVLQKAVESLSIMDFIITKRIDKIMGRTDDLPAEFLTAFGISNQTKNDTVDITVVHNIKDESSDILTLANYSDDNFIIADGGTPQYTGINGFALFWGAIGTPYVIPQQFSDPLSDFGNVYIVDALDASAGIFNTELNTGMLAKSINVNNYKLYLSMDDYVVTGSLGARVATVEFSGHIMNSLPEPTKMFNISLTFHITYDDTNGFNITGRVIDSLVVSKYPITLQMSRNRRGVTSNITCHLHDSDFYTSDEIMNVSNIVE